MSDNKVNPLFAKVPGNPLGSTPNALSTNASADPAPPPAITSAVIPEPGSTPRRRWTPPELAEDIVARPLMAPDFIAIKLKNPELIGYWGNRTAGGGLRFEQLVAMGFVPTKSDDVIDMKSCQNKDGKVVYGDLVHLKIDKRTYYGWLKNNHQKANQRVSREALQQRAVGYVNEETAGAPADLRRKISTFIPSQAEID